MKGELPSGIILKVAGPLVVAEKMSGSAMYELVRVGHSGIVGEIIRLDGDTASIQCYEETAGLRRGDPVKRTGKPLSVELGPGILRNIFDGIQRPLEKIFEQTQSLYIPRGVSINALDHEKPWHFTPTNLTVGTLVSGGELLGTVPENELVLHKIMVPPHMRGELSFLAAEGQYTLDDAIAKLKDPLSGEEHDVFMSHFWPVREPRPVREKVQATEPMLTGQRVLDAMYPTVLGGTCCIPGAFGCG
ncbi:MAG: hypothetical protein MHM6MM_008139, partial [Cercozoa sp. M6MM]